MSELLAHEVELINRAIKRGLEENYLAADDMMVAASDTNSWHDNAEYDEVIHRMKLIDARYSPLLKLFAKCVEIDYPQFSEPTIQIGSLVDADLDRERVAILLVGQTKEGTQDYVNKWGKNSKTELLVTSAVSPLGSVLRGLKASEDFSYMVSERSIAGKVHSVDQLWINMFRMS